MSLSFRLPGAVTRAALAAALLTASGAAGQEPTPERVRAAVVRALPLLQKAAAGHTENRSCFACHNQALPLMAMAAARSRGIAIDTEEQGRQVEAILAFLDRSREQYSSGKGTG